MEAANFAPAKPGERLAHIDVIRGLALFGVLVMNAQYHFRGPVELYAGNRHPSGGLLNALTDDALRLLVEGKAMTLFSVLFGVGLALQLERKEACGDGFWGFAFRRMGALFALGFLHVVLLWYGDILLLYALDGMLLFPFLRRKAKTVGIWLASLYGLLTAAMIAVGTVQMWDTSAIQERRAKGLAAAAARAEELLEGYLQTNWWDGLVFRVGHYIAESPGFLTGLLIAFLNLLLGLALWRTGVLRDPAAHADRLRRAARWLLPLGFAMATVHLYSRPIIDFAVERGGWAKALVYPVGLSQIFGWPVLALGYGAGLLLLWQLPAWQRALNTFAPLGRMALTNYLMQSLVMTALFYGWGLGLYGKVGPAASLGMCALLFAAQAWFSRWWLERFQFGPVEWLWRCLSYAQRQPFRKEGRALIPAPDEALGA